MDELRSHIHSNIPSAATKLFSEINLLRVCNVMYFATCLGFFLSTRHPWSVGRVTPFCQHTRIPEWGHCDELLLILLPSVLLYPSRTGRVHVMRHSSILNPQSYYLYFYLDLFLSQVTYLLKRKNSLAEHADCRPHATDMPCLWPYYTLGHVAKAITNAAQGALLFFF